MARTSELDYHLPGERIATTPAEPRDAARLMVVSRSDPTFLEHRIVRELPEILRSGELLVRNVSRVAPAKLQGRRRDTGGRFEGLFLEEISSAAPGPVWRALLRSNARLRSGLLLDLLDARREQTPYALELLERSGPAWRARLTRPDEQDVSTEAALDAAGATPLPPYIAAARRRRRADVADEADRAWYQTVYASEEKAGSVAAPTAGLHFTPELLERLAALGAGFADVILHVGEGTFRPVETERLEDHAMHEERFRIPASTLDRIRRTRAEGGRVLAIGTTTARALESVEADAKGDISGATRLLIAPGHTWRWIDGLMTNFHLPRSTLLAMVSSLFPEGPPRLLALYEEAVREGYRFYSYGDAMLILP